MITKIEVNGFKSLRHFDLKLHQGLNILVGPNGAGKTNIILFFEFLSNLVRYPIGNAISNVGGAGTIFQKKGKNQYVDEINCKIYGAYQQSPKKFFIYEYSFTINISFEKDNVYFSHQVIKIKKTSKFCDDPDKCNFSEDLDIYLIFDTSKEMKPTLDVKSYNKKAYRSQFLRSDKTTKTEFESILKEFILKQNPTYNSIIQSISPIADEFAYNIFSDLRGGETFNIIPSKVKELEDSATPPGINKDGSGLATTLYAMNKSKARQNMNSSRFWMYYEDMPRTNIPQTLDKIISFLKLANSSITDLTVENDPFNNKLLVKITINSGDNEAVLPLSSMSEGTIKWLTLITAILTSRTIFSIEEPENFLHPWMQAEIALIMRDHINEKKTQSFALMTTHSESFLNKSNPEEIIIVDMNDGKTTARRISNLSSIKDEISKSGFGLGYFYFSNELNNE